MNFHLFFFYPPFLDPDCWGMLINRSVHPRGHGVRPGRRRHPENGHRQCKGTSAVCARHAKLSPRSPWWPSGAWERSSKSSAAATGPPFDVMQPLDCGASLPTETHRNRSMEEWRQGVFGTCLYVESSIVSFIQVCLLLLKGGRKIISSIAAAMKLKVHCVKFFARPVRYIYLYSIHENCSMGRKTKLLLLYRENTFTQIQLSSVC